MNILVITGIFPPDIGGPATYVPQIAEGLVARGHKVTVLTLSDLPERGAKRPKADSQNLIPDSPDTQNLTPDTQYPFRVIQLSRQAWKPWRWLCTVLAVIRLGRRADVLFVNGLAMEAVLANLLLRKPMVQKVVGDLAWERAITKGWVEDSFEEFQSKRYEVRVELLKALRSWWTRRADRIIVPSQYLARWVATWGIPQTKIAVIYNSLEPLNGLRPARLPLQAPVKVVTVGRLVSWKGLGQVIEAVALLHGVGLVIVGDGPERLKLEEQTKTLNITERVYFAGRRSHEETLSTMAACDVFVLNSTYEGFPHVVLEAMSVGLPVVATAVGGTSEAMENANKGILIQPGDTGALCKALSDLTAPAAGIGRGPKKLREGIATRFSLSKMLSDTQQVIGNALKGSVYQK